jgi:hypothetical protein
MKTSSVNRKKTIFKIILNDQKREALNIRKYTKQKKQKKTVSQNKKTPDPGFCSCSAKQQKIKSQHDKTKRNRQKDIMTR